MQQDQISRDSAANRRNFLKGAGLAGLGIATTALVGASGFLTTSNVEAAAFSDFDILNFARSIWNTSKLSSMQFLRTAQTS